MSNEAAFLEAIRAAPTEDAARLIYADWLDEHDRAGGAFLRAECELASLGLNDPRRDEVLAKLYQASEGIPPWWKAAVSRPMIGNCGAVTERFADLDVAPRLWELIDSAKGDEGSMRSILAGLTREELIRFEAEFDSSVEELVFRVIGFHGDAYTEEETAGWVISQGSAHFAGVWDHPERFPPEAPAGEANFYGLAGVIFDERFGRGILDADSRAIWEWWPKVRGSTILTQAEGEPGAPADGPCSSL